MSPIPLPKSKEGSTISLGKTRENPVPMKPAIDSSRNRAGSMKSSRHMVQAGDLLIAKGNSGDIFRPLSRTFSVLKTPRVPYSSLDFEKESRRKTGSKSPKSSRWSADDFDLREEVMSCIAKSIGLLQPPLSGSDSVEASPASPPTDLRRPSMNSNTSFPSSFGSLSLLDLGDDASSMTGTSSIASTGNYLSGLDNEVEILFYAAGSTLAKAGEVSTGRLTPVSFLNACLWII